MMADAQAMPDVKAFAQAVEIAFDDLRALPLPHELQAQADAPAAVVGRAVRSARTRVTDAVKGVVGGAMQAAVGQVVRGAVKAAAGTAVRAAPKRAAAPSKRAAPRKAAGARRP
jgi:hypothetical protein